MHCLNVWGHTCFWLWVEVLSWRGRSIDVDAKRHPVNTCALLKLPCWQQHTGALLRHDQSCSVQAEEDRYDSELQNYILCICRL